MSKQSQQTAIFNSLLEKLVFVLIGESLLRGLFVCMLKHITALDPVKKVHAADQKHLINGDLCDLSLFGCAIKISPQAGQQNYSNLTHVLMNCISIEPS